MEQFNTFKGEHLAFIHAANLVKKYKAERKLLALALVVENIFIIIAAVAVWLTRG